MSTPNPYSPPRGAVRDLAEAPSDPADRIARLAAAIFPFYGLIDILFIFGEERQCLHDKIADTIVVRA